MSGPDYSKKRAALNGSLYFSGTEALRADMKFTSLSAAYVDLYALNIDEPATSGMAVRVADGISRCRPAAAAITEFWHLFPPLFILKQPT